MGLLGGGIKGLFGSVFGEIYLDGTLHKKTETTAANGDVSSVFADHPIKGQINRVTESMRQEQGYSAKDVAIFVLQNGVVIVPNTDDEITLAGKRWRVGLSVGSDPASSYWYMRGVFL